MREKLSGFVLIHYQTRTTPYSSDYPSEVNMFVEIPASKNSIIQRSPIYGVGTNDALYAVNPKVKGKSFMCPYFQRWKCMLERCYSDKFQKMRPTYIGCSVCDEWLIFSIFKSWMVKQNWEGMALDKDIINPGNKVYSPENCRFVTKPLNSLLLDHAARRGQYPQGVSFDKARRKYKAQISKNSRNMLIGRYLTVRLASSAYIKEKVKLIICAAEDQEDQSISNGLRLHASILLASLK